MIDPVEILRDVELQVVPPLRLTIDQCAPVLQLGSCSHGALADSAAVAVVDHVGVQFAIDLQIDRPLDDTIPEVQRHDEALLRLVNIELPVPADLVGLPEQVVLYADQFFLKVRAELRHVVAVPFLLCCVVIRVQQVFP